MYLFGGNITTKGENCVFPTQWRGREEGGGEGGSNAVMAFIGKGGRKKMPRGSMRTLVYNGVRLAKNNIIWKETLF